MTATLAPWVLVPCLIVLRSEFDTLAPGRDRGADGAVGDLAHQLEPSDHNPDETGNTPVKDADRLNEVHAIDVDSTGPWPAGQDLNSRVEIIRLRHQRGDDDRLQNIIWRGRIASRSWGWAWRAYVGASKHFDHAHFSARYTTAQEQDIRSWGVLVPAGTDPTGATPAPNPEEHIVTAPTSDQIWTDPAIAVTKLTGAQMAGSVKEGDKRAAGLLLQYAVIGSMTATKKLDQVLALLTGANFVADVLAGLTPEAIAAAVPADRAKQVADLLTTRAQA